MRRSILPFLGCLLFVACGGSDASETDRINAWFDEQFEEQLALQFGLNKFRRAHGRRGG
jgi:hypothetical protein